MIETYDFNHPHHSIVEASALADIYNYRLNTITKRESAIALPRKLSGDFHSLAISFDQQILKGKPRERFWSYAEAEREIGKLQLNEAETIAADTILNDMKVLTDMSNDEQDIHFIIIKGYNKDTLYQFHNDRVAYRALCSYYGDPTEWIFYQNADPVRDNIYTPTINAVVNKFPDGTMVKFNQLFIHRAPIETEDIPRLLLVANL